MKKTAENKSKKSKLVIMSCVGFFAVGAGVGVGYLAHNLFAGGNTVVHDESNSATTGLLTVDYDTLLNSYDAVTKSGGSYENSFTAAEMADIAIGKFAKSTSYFVQSKGNAAAGSLANQAIRSTFVHSGEEYFEESLSLSSFVSLADRMYQSGDTTTRYHGSISNGNVETGTYDETAAVKYKNDAYATKFGRNVSNTCSYIINKNTVLLNGKKNTNHDANSGVPTSVTKSDAGYTIELELDNYYGVYNYVVQMQAISNLASLPDFTYCHLTLVTDSTLGLISMDSHEYYYAKTSAGVGSNIEGKLKTLFASGGEYEIPELNTPCTYREGE
jgi:hypothetical protein